ncbi:cysteine--tRNA ligase [Candidatus Giovannonibacteria bacterium]|nr:cysteine--tRNA ligase [Candidatus Giovannonibacteria bacterium]
MPLKLYNTLTRKKEIFKSIKRNHVGFYTCGPTVYDFAHIGNLRTFIFEDLLKRTLKLSGYKVKHVMNITDVDDKTIKGSKASGKSLADFTKHYANEFFKDLDKLNILPASKYPAATKHIPEMIKIINILLKKGFAYKSADGIYFNISKFKNYGMLSRVSKKKLKMGARISSDEYAKNDAKDFILWKNKKGEEPSWPSPFGDGRPGWHIECSAMSVKYLGMPIDIHAAAIDLIFPHHENEIAQSEGAMGKKFVNYFLHGEHLNIEGRKMSKSLGNLYTLNDLEKKGFDPLDFRYLTLSAHYRSPLSFSWEALKAARNARLKLQEKMNNASPGNKKEFTAFKKNFSEALSDDLNIPKALALIWKSGANKESILWADGVLGLRLVMVKKIAIPLEVKVLMEKREAFRNNKNWAEADKTRKKILDLGFIIEDTPKGPKIKAK